MGKIIFDGLEFYGHHGLYEQEQKIGGKYIVDLELELDFSMASTSDNIEGTIDYTKIYELVKDEMAKSSKLIEHVGGRIVSMLFVTFKQIESIRLKLTKVKPPIKGDIRSVSILIEKMRAE